MAASDIDALANPQNPFRGQQVLTLIGSEQTTSSLVVMIDCSAAENLHEYTKMHIQNAYMHNCKSRNSPEESGVESGEWVSRNFRFSPKFHDQLYQFK